MPDATICVLTQHNDNSRTGAYLQETQLNTSNVNQNQFGKLFSYQVDGHVYAQPLYVNSIDIPGQGTHNVVYIATMHNTVYAFDADDPNAAISPIWARSLETSARLPDPNIGPVNSQGRPAYHDILVEVGIVSTPVISLDNNVIYVVAFTKVGNTYFHHLHALDLATGEEQLSGPAKIEASVPGTGYDSKNGSVTFTSNRQIQRAALLLANGTVYIAFASYGDKDPYHGWVLAYNATTLQRTAVYNTTPNGSRGGIWQAGQGPAADSDNYIYLMTGNGTATPDAKAVGCTVVKLRPNLTIADWFTPHNVAALNAADKDLGSAGPVLIPGINLLIGGGKESKFYLLDRNHLGHFNANNDNQVVQNFYVNQDTNKTHHIHGGPAYWGGPNGPWIYVWPENDCLKAYHLDGGKFQAAPVSQCNTRDPQNVPGGSFGMPGGFLSISANGNTAGTGILWASHPYNQDANQAVVEGIVRAYDASHLTNELWNSKQNASRDNSGKFAKFCPPTIANGKVYMATFSGEVVVYGLLQSPGGGDASSGTNANVSSGTGGDTGSAPGGDTSSTSGSDASSGN